MVACDLVVHHTSLPLMSLNDLQFSLIISP